MKQGRGNIWKQWMKWGLWRVPVVTLTLSILLKAGVNLLRIMSETVGKPMDIYALPITTVILYIIAGHFYFSFCRRREIVWSAILMVLVQVAFYMVRSLCDSMECVLGSFLVGEILQWFFQGGEGLRLWLQNSVGAPSWMALAAALALPFLLVPFGYIPRSSSENG